MLLPNLRREGAARLHSCSATGIPVHRGWSAGLLRDGGQLWQGLRGLRLHMR